jgi:hypothetical protein
MAKTAMTEANNIFFWVILAHYHLRTLICRYMLYFTDGYTDGIKRVIFFGVLYLFVHPLIYLLPTDSPTIHKLPMS